MESCEKQFHHHGLAPWFEAELTAPLGNQQNSSPRNAGIFHPLIRGASQPQGTSLAGEPCDIKVRFKMTYFLGPTPCEEDCASVGDEFYRADSRIEIAAYIKQLQRTFVFHTEKPGIAFAKKRESHEFGGYFEAIAEPLGTNGFGFRLAEVIEDNTPTEWDLVAIQEIISESKDRFFDAQDLSVDGVLSWMATTVSCVAQGRRMLAMLRKVRDGIRVTTNEVSANLALDPQDQAPSVSDARRFVAVFADARQNGATFDFECSVSSSELAVVQAKAAFPDCDLLMHFAADKI